MRDSDLDQLSEQPSEDEVLAPRIVDPTPDRSTPTRRPRGPAGSQMTTPLLVGTALAVVVVVSAGLFAVGLIASVWLGGG